MSERGDRFLLLFALANAGSVIAYVPLLTLLLPAKVAGLAAGAHVEWLGAATLVGAISASIANVAFGWASDVVGTRRGWAAAGLALTIGCYGLLHAAQSLPLIVALIALYQIALNMLLSPLAAWAADMVPDRRKGLLGGLLGAGPLIGALGGVIATLPIFTEVWMRMAAVCALILVLTLPVLLARFTPYEDAPAMSAALAPRPSARLDFALLWLARLLVQIAGSVMFAFLFYYFQSLPDAPAEAGVARLAALALLVAFPLGLVSGAVSDRVGRRKPFLVAAAGFAAAGLFMMTSARDYSASVAGYVLFGAGSGVFLALHSGYAMQLLPSPTRRGRDLGLLNLANTFPGIIAPLLAISLVPGRGFGPLLALLTVLMLTAGALICFVRQERPSSAS